MHNITHNHRHSERLHCIDHHLFRGILDPSTSNLYKGHTRPHEDEIHTDVTSQLIDTRCCQWNPNNQMFELEVVFHAPSIRKY